MPPKASTLKGSANDDKQPEITAFFGKAPLRESPQPAAAASVEPGSLKRPRAEQEVRKQ
jgi:hypothetical protein